MTGIPEESESDSLQRLHRISKALNSELHLDRLLEIIMDHVVEVSGAERGFLVLAAAGDEPEVRVARNFEQEDVQSPEGGFSASIVKQVMDSGQAVLTANAIEDDRFQDTLSIAAIRARSVMALPFRVRGAIVGAAYVDNRLQRGAFGKAELATLSSLMDLAGTAIERARLYEENERHLREVETLNERLKLRVATHGARARRDAGPAAHGGGARRVVPADHRRVRGRCATCSGCSTRSSRPRSPSSSRASRAPARS